MNLVFEVIDEAIETFGDLETDMRSLIDKLVLRGVTPWGKAWDSETALRGVDPRVERAKLIVERVESVWGVAKRVALGVLLFAVLPILVGMLIALVPCAIWKYGSPDDYLFFTGVFASISALPLPLYGIYDYVKHVAEGKDND